MGRTAPSRLRSALVASLFVTTAGCATGYNHSSPDGPVSAGSIAPPPEARWRQPLHVVSFNVEYGRAVEGAAAVLADHPELRGADVVLLQEMDGDGVETVARELGMNWVYHAATRRGDPPTDFGNAVLSRWPIVDADKLVLPHRSIFGRTLRTATAATLRVGRTEIRVYSVHLATPVNQAWRDRKDQMRAVLRDARNHPHVIVGGDLNSEALGRIAVDRGYRWPTEAGPRTVFFGRVDHILTKGFDPPPGDRRSGTAEIPDGISDHRPVWAIAVIR